VRSSVKGRAGSESAAWKRRGRGRAVLGEKKRQVEEGEGGEGARLRGKEGRGFKRPSGAKKREIVFTRKKREEHLERGKSQREAGKGRHRSPKKSGLLAEKIWTRVLLEKKEVAMVLGRRKKSGIVVAKGGGRTLPGRRGVP